MQKIGLKKKNWYQPVKSEYLHVFQFSMVVNATFLVTGGQTNVTSVNESL